MISKEVINFLELLSNNNTKEWFQENKDKYDLVKKEFDLIALKVIALATEVDGDIGALVPKDCTFRIYRDIRFSNDKTPYKTNMGVFVNKGGKKSLFGGYYLHIEPGNSFVGGGIHMPSSSVLGRIRQEIYNFREALIEIIDNKDFKEVFGTLQGDKLKGAPRGFSKDFEYIEFLKYKSYTVGVGISDDELLSVNIESKLKYYFTIMSPLVKFLNHAVSENQ